MNLLYSSSELVEITEHVHACRDEDDDYLLDIAVNSLMWPALNIGRVTPANTGQGAT